MQLSKTKSLISQLLSEFNGEFVDDRIYQSISVWPDFSTTYGVSCTYYFTSRNYLALSYSPTSYMMVFYVENRTVECPFVSIDSKGEVLIGEALGDEDLESYGNWTTPTSRVLKKIGIDIEVYQDLLTLYNLFEPLMANLYVRKLGQSKKNVI
jgi:hypothetical protein